MAFDRNIPAPHAELASQMFRDQFNGLDDKILALPAPATPTLSQVLVASNNAGGNSITGLAALNFAGTLIISEISGLMRLDSNVPLILHADHGPALVVGAQGLDCAGSLIANVQAPVANSDADTKGARDTAIATALAGNQVLAAPVSAPVLGNSQLGFSVDEPGNQLVITVKYSDGTVKSATLPLV